MNETEANTLGLRIQAGRKAAGLSQEALGERLGVSRQAVSKWESDAAIPELENLIAMSRMFGVSVGVLLGVEEAEASVSLSEQELQAAQTIAEKYAEQTQKPSRIRRMLQIGAAVLVCAAVVSILQYRTNHRITDLNEQMVELQMQMNDIQNGVAGQLAQFTSQMRELLHEQDGLVSHAEWDIVRVNLEEDTVSLNFNLSPKVCTETTDAMLVATLPDGYSQSEMMQPGNAARGFFSVKNWELPMVQNIRLSVIFTDNGVAQQEELQILDLSPENFSLSVDGFLAAHYTSLSRTVQIRSFSLTICSPGYHVYPLSGELCLFRNGETEPEVSIPFTSLLRENGNSLNPKYDVELYDMTGYETSFELNDGDTVAAAIRITDNYGLTYYAGVKIFALDPNGKIFVDQPTDWQPGTN